MADYSTPPSDSARPRLLLLDGHSLGLPGVLRAAGRELLDDHRPAHQRRLRLHLDAHQRAARRDARRTSAVAFDVSRQTFRSEEYSEYKANRSTSPTEFKGRSRWSRRCSTRCGSSTVEKDGFEADDVIATLATPGRGRAGFDVLICSGDRDAFQLVSDHVTVLYPRAGVSDLARMTPAAVERALRRPARAATPTSPRWWASRATTSPACPASARRPRRSGSTSSARSTRSSPGSTRSPARPATSLREHLADVIRNRRINELVRDLELPVARRTTCASSRGTATRCTQIFDGLEFRVLRDRLFETLSADEPEIEPTCRTSTASG